MKVYEFDKATRKIYENQKIPFGIYQYVNDRLEMLLVSDGMCKNLGVSRETFMDDVEKNEIYESHPEDMDGMVTAFLDFYRSGDEGTLDIFFRAKKKDATDYHIMHAQGEHIFMEDGTRLEQIWYIDESESKANSDYRSKDLPNYLLGEAINTRSYYDPLTGLPNMSFFLKLAKSFLEKAREEKKSISICTLNLCGLKTFNARYGFDEGNSFIKLTGEVLTKYFSLENCARFGEDHFFFYDYSEGIESKLYRVFEDMKNANDGRTLPVRVGIYNLGEFKEDNIDLACDKARIASDWYKNVTTSRFIYFDEKMNEVVNNRNYIVNNIDNAIKEEHIKVFFQPQVRLLNNKLYGAEALARWDDPEYGFLTPSVFIPILEESNLTYKLDIYIIRKVIEHLEEQFANGIEPIPISLNLSWADFLFMNPAKFITRIANDHNIPTKYIRVEITESTIKNDPEIIEEQIKTFRNNGFEVLMDDYGNGFSSLNILRDYPFDAIKIDGGFIRKFDDRSKEIIKSTILMAKTLGVHTIVEGVETEEQISFLRNLGCEVVQGYYYGEPLPYEDAHMGIRKQGIFYEDSEERTFFDRVGLENLIVDSPVALFLYDGLGFELYYANEEYLNNRYDAWNSEVEDIAENGAGQKQALVHHLKKVADRAVTSGKTESLVFVVDNKYYKLECTDIAGFSRGHMQRVTYYDINAIEDNNRTEVIDGVLRNILTVYNNVYSIDFDNDEVTAVVTENVYEQNGNTLKGVESVLLGPVQLEHVFPADRKLYMAQINKEYITKKLSGERNSFSQIFRIKNGEDSYEWTEYLFLKVRSSKSHKVVLCLRAIEKESQKGIMNELKRVFGQYAVDVDFLSESVMDANLDENIWKNFVENSNIKLFWKDKERRFLGATNAFLDFYGFKSIDSILGKTDEEMGWHPDDARYKNDEEDVINKGITVKDSPGQILAKGVVKNIQATKFPLFANGNIVGLMGYFDDAETLLSHESSLEESIFVDPGTGLLNVRGLYIALQTYDDNFRINGVTYAISTIEIPEYSNIYVNYGKQAADILVEKVADAIKKTFSGSECIAQIRNCSFAVAIRVESVEEMEINAKACIDYIESIREIDGHACRIIGSYGTVMCDEQYSVQQLLGICMKKMEESRTDSRAFNDMLMSAVHEVPDVYKDMPLPFMVSRVVYDESGTIPIDVIIIFVNKRYLELTNKKNEDLIGKHYTELFPNTDDLWVASMVRAGKGEHVRGKAYGGALGAWVGFVMSESSIPGCTNTVMWPLESDFDEGVHKIREHEVYNSVLKIVRYLNEEEDYDTAILRCIAEIGEAVDTDEVKILSPSGESLYTWHPDGLYFDPDYDDLNIDWDTDILDELFGDKALYITTNIKNEKKITENVMKYITDKGIHCFILAKIINKGELKGYLGIGNYNTNEIVNIKRVVEESAYFLSTRMVD